MKNYIKYTFFLFMLSLCGFPVLAQQQEDFILKAMKDELARSMDDLKLEGFDKPFYISYTVNDIDIFNVVATLGATFDSQDLPFRGSSVRILVGSYEFNDESLDNNLFTNPSGLEISMPINDDYWGIRRALWSSTDNVYKNATRQFQKNTLTLADQKKDLKDVPHRSFAKTPVVKLITQEEPIVIDKVLLEATAKELSAIFKEFKEIDNSTVVLNYSGGYTYFVNSEGSEIKTYKSVFQLQISAQTRTEKGEPVFDQLSYMLASPASLPSLDHLKKETTDLAQRVVKLKNSTAFQDEYSGPVLFEGQSVANVFSNALFASNSSLMASDNIENTTGYRFDANSTLDLKVGKKVTSDLLTVTAKSKMKKYGEVDLMGSFEVDSEGVVPVESLVLIENGQLDNLLNDRTITQENQTATGHNDGPGVVEVTIKQAPNKLDLKQQLIQAAKNEGLDHAIIIRDLSFGGMGFVNVYKVSVTDAKEELLRSANIKLPDLKALRKLLSASQNKAAYNVQIIRGGIVSMIVPDAILVEDVDLKSLNIPFLKEEIYISSPLD